MRRLLTTAALLLIPLAGTVLATTTVEKLIEELGKPADKRLVDMNGGRTGPDPFTAHAVVEALAAIGEPAKAAIPALVKALGANYLHVPRNRIGLPIPPPDFRVAAAELLARFRPDTVLPVLDALATGNANARRFALVALGKMGEDAALHVASIGKALGDDAEDVRVEAAEALAAIGWKAAEAVPALIENLAERGHRERLARLRALAAIRTGSSEALDAFARAVEDRKLEIDPETFRAILDWLGSLGERGVPGLVTLIRRAPLRVERKQQGRRSATVAAGLGKAGRDALLRLLDLEKPPTGLVGERFRVMLLEVLTTEEPLPKEAVPAALELLFGRDFQPGTREAAAKALGAAGKGNAAAVLRRMGELESRFAFWYYLGVTEGVAPELAREVGRLWLAEKLPARSGEGFDEAGVRRTDRLGGSSGGAFEVVGAPGSLLVGLKATVGWYGRNVIVRSLTPLFLDGAEVVEGATHGRRAKSAKEIRADEGYAIGGLVVKFGHRLDGFAAIFMRIDGDRLDPTDLYLSRWVGGTSGGPEAVVGAQGHAVSGVHGRAGNDIDAIGLVERR